MKRTVSSGSLKSGNFDYFKSIHKMQVGKDAIEAAIAKRGENRAERRAKNRAKMAALPLAKPRISDTPTAARKLSEKQLSAGSQGSRTNKRHYLF